jgi:hypothetical protein
LKTYKNILTLVILAALAAAGCKKKAPAAPPPYTINGVNVDSPKLAVSLANASPEAKTHVTEFEMSLRYQSYDKGLAALDKLANDPSLSESQKKVVNEVIEELKQLIAKGPTR